VRKPFPGLINIEALPITDDAAKQSSVAKETYTNCSTNTGVDTNTDIKNHISKQERRQQQQQQPISINIIYTKQKESTTGNYKRSMELFL
jgi:hypothetical protein